MTSTFVVPYRPVFRLATGEIHAMVAWVPWADSVGDRMLEDVCRQAAAWERSGIRPHIAFDISPSRLRRHRFADELADRVRTARLDPSWFTVEVAASVAAAGDDEIGAVLGRLREHGFRIAVDDFDGRYASLACLRDLPVDELKIDRPLVAGALDMHYVVEHIESQEQLDALVRRNCAVGRGFRRAEPMSAEQATALLRRSSCEASVDLARSAVLVGSASR